MDTTAPPPSQEWTAAELETPRRRRNRETHAPAPLRVVKVDQVIHISTRRSEGVEEIIEAEAKTWPGVGRATKLPEFRVAETPERRYHDGVAGISRTPQLGGLMILTVASFKGGVGKSTAAVHLAAYLQSLGPTVLVDGDPNRSISGWARRGSPPFLVVDEREAPRHIRDAAHAVVDTPARPSREDLESLANGCDLLVIPTTADAFALDALVLTVDALRSVPAARFRVLLSIVPPRPSRDGDEARATIATLGLPIFAGSIRRAVAFQRAALAGCLVSEVKDPRAVDAWGDYENVGREIL